MSSVEQGSAPPIFLRMPKGSLGQMLSEEAIKRGLKELNKDIDWDLGAKLNMPHPEIDYCQGVFLLTLEAGKRYITPMDRGWMLQGMVSEKPVWTTSADVVEVPHWEVTPEEIARQPEMYPMPCMHDENLWQVIRQEKQELILTGWRYTFDKLVKARVPGITVSTINEKFRVNMARPLTVDEVEVRTVEADDEPWAEHGVEEGEVLDEMGEYEARPTVVLTDGG